jgi:hypothetical protein
MTIDRFAEKYTSMTPYQYGANNPIKFIDINGDSLDIGGNMSGSFQDIQSMVSKKHRDRLSYDSGTGEVSLNTEGLKRKDDGQLKNKSLAFMENIITAEENYLYENTEEFTVQKGMTKIVDQSNGVTTYVLEGISEQVLNSNAAVEQVFSTTPYNSLATGNYLEGVKTTQPNISSRYQIPKDGYDGQVAVNPSIQFPSNVSASLSRSGLLTHALREAYFRTTHKLPYQAAHRMAGGVKSFPKGTIVGGVKH